MLIKTLIICAYVVGGILLLWVYVIIGALFVRRFLRKNMEESNRYIISSPFIQNCACVIMFIFWPLGVVIGTAIGFIRSFLFEKTGKNNK
ncbi:hypothetical protein ES703_31637 [subsurface metagenome]